METPVRPNALPQVSTIADADALIVDGVDGLRGIKKVDFEAQLAGAPSSSNPSDSVLKEIVDNGGPHMLTSVPDSDGVVMSGTVQWPDGSLGVYTTTVKNTTFNAIDAFTVTHTNSGKTVTQPAVTRDGEGQQIITPALTVS